MDTQNIKIYSQSRVTRRSLLKFTAVAVGATSLGGLLAACGEDEDTGGGADTATTEPTTGTGGGADTATSEPTTGTGGGADTSTTTTEPTAGTGTSGGETYTVEMTAQSQFDPKQLTVKVGDTITWKVVGAMPHSTTSDPAKAADESNAQVPDGAETWDSGILTGEGTEFSYTVEVAGEYTYFCIPHESLGMIGNFTAEE